MDVRKSAVDLDEGERHRFREAILKLKAKPAPGLSGGTSVYDQFVALHGTVMAVLTPKVDSPVNSFVPQTPRFSRSRSGRWSRSRSGRSTSIWNVIEIGRKS